MFKLLHEFWLDVFQWNSSKYICIVFNSNKINDFSWYNILSWKKLILIGGDTFNKINITSLIISPHPNTWWNMAMVDISWQRDMSKKYRLHRMCACTVHHRFCLASSERLNWNYTKCKILSFVFKPNIVSNQHSI